MVVSAFKSSCVRVFQSRTRNTRRRCTSVSPRAGTKHAHTSKHVHARTYTHTGGLTRVSRTPLQREHTGACLYVHRARAVYLLRRRRLAARLRVCRVSMHAQLRSIAGIHHAKVSTCTLDIDQSGIIRPKRIAAVTIPATGGGLLSNGITITAVYSLFERRRTEEETSIMRHERSCATGGTTYASTAVRRIFRDR